MLAERKCHQSDFSDCPWNHHILSPLFLFSVHFTLACPALLPPSLLVGPHLSSLSDPIPSLSGHSLPSSALSLSLLSYFLLFCLRTWVENKWDTCQSKKAPGGWVRCFGRVSAYLFSLEWCFSESLVLLLCPCGTVTSPWAEWSTGSICNPALCCYVRAFLQLLLSA